MRIVFVSHAHIGGTFVVGSHHLARELASVGHVVAHVSTPVTPLHLLRLSRPDVRQRFRLWARPRQVDGVLNIVPMSWIPRSIMSRIPLIRRQDVLPIRRTRRILHSHLKGPIDLLLVDQPKLVSLVRRLRSPITVYRPTDLYHAMPGNAGIE